MELARKIAYATVKFLLQERGVKKVTLEYGCSVCKFETNNKEEIWRHVIDVHRIRTIKKPRIKHGQVEWQQSPKDFIIRRGYE